MADPAISSPPADVVAGRPLALPDLLPVRMLNEVVYCPRLFALEWMNTEWADSGDTIKGRSVHKRVDDAGRTLSLIHI